MAVYNNVNIKDLNQIEEITNGNFLIVENEQGTNIIDFINFVLGPNNVSFYSSVETLSTNVNNLSSQASTDKSQANTDLVTASGNIMARTPSITLTTSTTPIANCYNIFCYKGNTSVASTASIGALTKPTNAVITQSDINLMMTSVPGNSGAQFYISSLTNGGAGNSSFSFVIACTTTLATPVTVYYTILTPY
jgi:hypothetical protein